MYKSIELFAGCGGLALGLERAGFNHVLVNEIDKTCCKTLRHNTKWPIIEADIRNIEWNDYDIEDIDLVSGGVPCQAFSIAGNRLGFSDDRGTMFYEFARALQEIKPKLFLFENVGGLLNHNEGRTLSQITKQFSLSGYSQYIEVYNTVNYKVPQKRERLIIVGVRKDLQKSIVYEYTRKIPGRLTLRDALKDVPDSPGMTYPERKAQLFSYVPPGGCWRDINKELVKGYMGKSLYASGGQTGVLRRLSLDEPCPTLLCSPSQKRTERCHPDEIRPLTIREYARIQTFPDNWEFCGSITNQYKQIGNAVPVQFAFYLGRSIIKALDGIEEI